MFSKKLMSIPIVALLLLVAGILATGAYLAQGVRVPPGQIVESPHAGANDRPANPAPPAAPSTGDTSKVAFSDQFSTSNLDSWQSLASAPGNWVAQDGRLQQRGISADGELSEDNAVLLIKGVTFDNDTLQAQIYPSSGSPLGLVFRGSDAGYYRLTLFQNLPSQDSMALLE